MMDWWNGLTTLNQVFFGCAAFFSVIFLWQFISSMIGLAGGEVDVEADVDTDVDVDTDIDLDDIEAHSIEEAAESAVAFRILSVRAVLAFCTLFSWAAALYMDSGKSTGHAIVLATAWGLGAWLFVAVLLHWLRKLAETGTPQIGTAVGRRGTVYVDIPAAGQGEVRVLVSGAVTLVKARGAGDSPIEAGTPVRVVRTLDSTSIEVEPVDSEQ